MANKQLSSPSSNESGSSTTFTKMNFDSLVTRFEHTLLPVVRKEEDGLRSAGNFSEVQVVSIRHGESIHAMGIACRPVWATDELERLSFTATLIGFKDLSGRIDVQWSQVFSPRIGLGYLKRETKGFHDKLMSETAIMRYEREWTCFSKLFLRVAARGKPSNYLLRRLRGATRDQHGWKEEHSV